MDDAPPSVRRTVETVWRMEAARLIAGLVPFTHDVALAEDVAQDALVAALAQWPESGVPTNPGAWLMTVAKRRALDQFRRAELASRKYAEVKAEPREPPEDPMAVIDSDPDPVADDDLLRLMFICCHPALSVEAQVALTLRLLGGLSTSEIARAFLTPETTIGARITRAKKTLGRDEIAFELPAPDERGPRLAAVLAVTYLIFNEGYAATSGPNWTRPELCYEALRLGRMLAAVAPDEPEVHGLIGLMEIQASRMAARVGADGRPVLLLEQNRARWDRLLIRRGLTAVGRAAELITASAAAGGAADGGAAERAAMPGSYQLQAEIAACHARARVAADTDWARIAALYERLVNCTGSPIVELNRAVAVAMAEGPAAGLAVADALCDLPALANYHLLPSVRADLLAKLDRRDEARAEFERAASLTANEQERELLLERARQLS